MTAMGSCPIGPGRGAAVSADLVARVAALVEARCGLQFDEPRRSALTSAVRTRMEHLGLEADEAYYELIAANHGDMELRSLINLVTVTETRFFRDPAQFRLLRRHILPTLLDDRAAAGRKALRVWSAGCSSGEEAYSIAISLCEMGLFVTHRDWQFDIVGTDVNTHMLERAREGLYHARALRLVPDEIRTRYFHKEGGLFRLTDEVRRLVRFEFGNLTDDPLPVPGEPDVVFCKHVVIYFRPETVERLVGRLYEALAPGGYLILGPTESLWSVAHRFSLVDHDGAFCYRKAHGSVQTIPPGPRRPPRRRLRAPARAHAPQPVSMAAATGPEADAEYERWRTAFQAGEWVSAQAGLEALVARHPDFVPARLLLGGLYAHRGRYEEALAEAAAVLRLDDLEARAYLLAGMIEARRGRADEALQALRRALYLNDALLLGHFWLANLYRDRGEWDRARLEYEQVVRRYDQRTFDLPDDFAADLTVAQLVDFCRRVAEMR